MQAFINPDLATDEEINLALAEIEKAFAATKEVIALFDKVHAIAIKAQAKYQPL
jgi:hypothetical protein